MELIDVNGVRGNQTEGGGDVLLGLLDENFVHGGPQSFISLHVRQ